MDAKFRQSTTSLLDTLALHQQSYCFCSFISSLLSLQETQNPSWRAQTFAISSGNIIIIIDAEAVIYCTYRPDMGNILHLLALVVQHSEHCMQRNSLRCIGDTTAAHRLVYTFWDSSLAVSNLVFQFVHAEVLLYNGYDLN